MTAGHLFWITSRAAGILALLLATMAAIAVHAGALLGDSYLSPSLADITVPFASSFHRLWTTLGTRSPPR